MSASITLDTRAAHAAEHAPCVRNRVIMTPALTPRAAKTPQKPAVQIAERTLDFSCHGGGCRIANTLANAGE
jgi:hypothetical protein